MSRVDDRDPNYWEMDTKVQDFFNGLMGHTLDWQDVKQHAEYLLEIANDRLAEEEFYNGGRL